MGLRNPWRFSFDTVNMELYIADVGQVTFEEINVIAADSAGVNYGWKVMEGNDCYDPDPIDVDCPSSTASCNSADYTAPVYEYSHGLGCSVTGGFVYRGSIYPNMVGYYMFIDYCTSRIWSLISDGDGGWLTNEQTLGGYGNITSFGLAEDGEIYAAEDGNSIYHLIDNSVVPIDLFDFVGTEKDEGIHLSWHVGSYENFSHFEIEKRAETTSFKAIGSLYPSESDLIKGEFSFDDREARYLTQYYRIKMVDLNGHFSYSSIIKFHKSFQSFGLFPNPAKDIIYLHIPNSQIGQGSFSVFDAMGRVVDATTNLDDESHPYINTENLKEGLYLVCYENGTFRSCQKVIIRK
jgi:hypothetical protein